MELLVVTLAHTIAGKEADGLARMRVVGEIVRTAHGLLTARFYRSRGLEAYYLMLTTWEDEESWQRAKESRSPKMLLLSEAHELLVDPPEQWLMHYLWGYSRPAAAPTLAAAHLAAVLSEQAERTQRAWVESLRRQAVAPNLSFAFLARGFNEDTPEPTPEAIPGATDAGEQGNLYQYGSIFLNLLSWPGEADRELFYADDNYKAISRFLGGVGVLQVLTLDPL